MFGTADRCAEDMGMSRRQFFRVVNSLIEKRLVQCIAAHNVPTWYRINVATLMSLRGD